MSERGKRVVRVLLDRERDADVVERIERQGSITGYLRMLVRRDIHDERIDYAAMKAAELQAENAKLRELVRELWNCALQYHRFDVYRHEIGVDGCGIGCTANGEGCCACKLEQRMRELGVEV